MDGVELCRLSSDEYELCLKGILSSIRPSEDDRAKRLNVINDLATLLQTVESLQGAVVKPFGSFVSNLYTRWGDLDISVEVSHGSHISVGRNRKQSLLRELMRALRRRGVALTFQFIPQARVPLLKFESSYQKISCDVSIDNHLGHIKSKILLLIADMDERFRDMVLLTKEWAKAQHINNPKSGTLNSFSLCLLVIFHFQTCDPAILPPLKEIYGGNIGDDITGMGLITERNVEDVCAENIATFRSQSFGSRNQSSLHELLISFFQKFSSIGTRASGEAICTYTGRWERITSNPRWTEKRYSLLVEDPFEQPENAARAVGLKELLVISHAFRDASSQISSVHAKNYMLTNFVRSSITSQVPSRTENKYTANGVNGLRSGPPKVGLTRTRFQNGRLYTHPQNPPLPEQSKNGVQYTHPRTVSLPEQLQSSSLPDQFQNTLKLDRHHLASSSTTVLPRQRASPSTTKPKIGQTHHVSIPNDTWFQNGRHYTYSQNGGQYTYPQNPSLPEQSQNGGQYSYPRTVSLPEQFQNSPKLDWHHPASPHLPNGNWFQNGHQYTYSQSGGQHTHPPPLPERSQNGGQSTHPPTVSLPEQFQNSLNPDRHHPASSSTTILPRERAQSQSTTMILPRQRAQSQTTTAALQRKRAQSMQSQQVWMPRYAEQ